MSSWLPLTPKKKSIDTRFAVCIGIMPVVSSGLTFGLKCHGDGVQLNGHF